MGGKNCHPCPARGVYDIAINISKLWKDDHYSQDEEWNFGVGNVFQEISHCSWCSRWKFIELRNGRALFQYVKWHLRCPLLSKFRVRMQVVTVIMDDSRVLYAIEAGVGNGLMWGTKVAENTKSLCSQEHERISIRFGLNPPLKSKQSTVDGMVIRAALLVQQCPLCAEIDQRLWDSCLVSVVSIWFSLWRKVWSKC